VSEESHLPHGENNGKLSKLKRNCLNCQNLGEDWTCRVGGRREIGNSFEERADCGDWKPAGATLGLIQVFPPCTPEYDVIIQETVERALADYSGQEGRDDSVQKGGESPTKRVIL